MPVQWQFERDSLGVFRVSGKLGISEFEQAQNQCESAIQKTGNIRILVLLEDFSGWETGGGWEDTSFAERNDPYIDKIAIVGDMQWRDLVYAFMFKGLRPVAIEYFEASEEASAREWLSSDK